MGMSDLRSLVIEAAAASVWNKLPRYELSYPECERTAVTVLDAVLEALTDNDEVWMEAGRSLHEGPFASDIPNMTAVSRLIAALRGTK